MAEDTLGYWDNIIVKYVEVEDKIFRIPLCEFVPSPASEVVADMFLLPSGPAARSEGQDKEHPIVLGGYKKDEFACLLKVMYPTAGPVTNSELHFEKEEWVSVLKLSTIWNMKKIRRYAIRRLSTVLAPIEKILLARAHRVASWLDEAVTSLASGDCRPTLEDLATLGWETAARILWIRDNWTRSESSSLKASNTLCFKRDAIKCGNCPSSSSLISTTRPFAHCGMAIRPGTELTFPGPGSPIPGTADRLVMLKKIICRPRCGEDIFYSISFHCDFCKIISDSSSNVRITHNLNVLRDMIKEMFGEEIKNYEL